MPHLPGTMEGMSLDVNGHVIVDGRERDPE